MTAECWRFEQVAIAHRLQPVSLRVQTGEKVGIIGPSGAGKTTFLELFNRLRDPDGGEIFFQSRSLKQISPITLRRQVALVLQEPTLLDMTVEAALTYPLQLQQRSRPEIQATLALWCERLQIPDLWRDREAWQLSVGQRQLVAIARALMLKPQVLLLDEPTSALDEGSAQLVFEVLQSCADLTWLMINHQLDWVRHYCDRVLVLNAGQLTHDQTTKTFDWGEFSQLLKRDRDTWEEDEL